MTAVVDLTSADPDELAQPLAIQIKLVLEEQEARFGVTFDPTATPEKARALMQAYGVRPEDDVFSRDIIRARYPEEEE